VEGDKALKTMAELYMESGNNADYKTIKQELERFDV